MSSILQTDFKVGDRVWYVFSDTKELLATVQTIGKKRIVILVDGTVHKRNTLPKYLRHVRTQS